jgi:phage/plasmid-like protein (TIGR03299 family)
MIRAAHLDWEVQSQPIYDAEGKVIEGYRTTVRADNGMHLGVVTDSYRVVQNAVGFRFLDDLLKGDLMRYESAGALRGGRTVWALARLPSVDTIAEGDILHRYCLWLNSHDGTGSIYAIPTSVRVVCANTAALAIKGQRGIKHVGDMAAKLKQAHELLAQADRQFKGFHEKAQVLASRRYSRVDARQYISTLLPSPDEVGRSLSIRERKVESIRSALRNERQNIRSIQGTWWSLYNAVTEAVDHGAFYGWKSKGVQRAENRMASVMFGPAADFKNEAFALAYDMAFAA